MGDAEFGIGGVRDEDLVQLGEHPLLCHVEHQSRIAAGGGEGLGMKREPELCGEAHQPQHPEPVLAEHGVGVAHGAEHPRLDVLHTSRKVGVRLGQRVEIDGVHREIPSQRVRPHIPGESHLFGAVDAARLGIAVRPERGVFRRKTAPVYARRAQAHTLLAYFKIRR